MNKVISFPGHKWARCNRIGCNGCFLCEGGLALCVTCGGDEGSLTSDCPGEMVCVEVADKVYKADLDYRAGIGWVPEPSETWKPWRTKRYSK